MGEFIYQQVYDSVVQKYGDSMTSDGELNSIAEEWSRNWGDTKWIGCFDRDRGLVAIEQMPRDSCLILNTHNAPGVHWIAVMRFKDGRRMSYDSFGRSFRELFRSRIKGMNDTEDDAEQAEWQMDCGQRCLAWLLVAVIFGYEYAWQV